LTKLHIYIGNLHLALESPGRFLHNTYCRSR